MDIIESFLNNKPEGFLVVGLGASAGGIQALQEFFQHVAPNSGVAYVVILHLSPDHDSQLAQVLQTVSTIPVVKVTERVKIEVDHIYVVPPNQHLVLQDGNIVPLLNQNTADRRAPVDIFFRHLADTYGPRAVAVILSGTGADGSMGVKRLKELGGVIYVQNPREAEFNEMPRNAIATELVDEILPVADIPGAIIAYRNNIGLVQIEVETEKRPNDQQQALREIFTQLRLKTGHDFSNYKRPTIMRRIERRINIHNLPNLPAYADLLQKNPEETTALLKDLLISVTNFFRDKKAFDAIEHDVIPALLEGKKKEDQVRVWVAGCATGEEAYSLAMLFAERTLGVIDAPTIQIFATDIDETAIAVAREGLYTINDAADVSTERLRRFFNKEQNSYQVRRELREMILFANHNFLKDPPFSRLDLVTCRNVLIYLNQTAQERVMETFHFALKPRAFLFVGTSESVDSVSDLFAIYNREHHIYRGREVSIRHYPVPETVPQFPLRNNLAKLTSEKEPRNTARSSFGELHQKLLEEYAPPSVVVNAEYDLVHMSEKAGKYFEFTAGEPTQNLLKLVKSEVRLELRTALYKAVQNQTPVEAKNLRVNIDNQVQSINLQIRPVLKGNGSTLEGYILVIFQPNENVPDAGPMMVALDEPVAKQLEEELVRLKAQLRKSHEDHLYQAEELKAANEELQAMNEELRSAAEELETSKEELQSINEELSTVNQELKVKIEEVGTINNNLQNLINSADIATIFLDRSFRVRMFTPAVQEVFNLIPSDFGRPISDITNRLDNPTFLEDAETVLDKLTLVEREVKTSDNQYYIVRILPYRTAEDRINGVVISFISISRRKKIELALRRSEERFRLLIESAKDYAIITQDTDRRITSWSNGAAVILGYTEQEMIGQSGDIIFTPEDREAKVHVDEAERAEREERAINERWHLRKDGSRFWGSGSLRALRDNEGKLIGFVKIMRDLTESKQADKVRRESEERKEFLLKLNDAISLLNNPVEIQYEASRLLAEKLGADRVHFAEVDEDEELVIHKDYARGEASSIAGAVRANDVTAAVKLDGNEPVVIPDLRFFPLLSNEEKATFNAVKISSQLSVAISRLGKKVASLAADQTKPRDWTSLEVSLLQEAAERTWLAVERAKAEKLLRETEEQFRLLVTAISDSVYRMSADWKLMYNLEGKGFLADTTAAEGSWLEKYIPGHERERVKVAIEESIKNKSVFQLEHEIIDINGNVSWAYTRAVPKLSVSGEIIEWIGAATNFTNRKTVEEAVRISEKRFRTVTNAVPQVIWTNDAGGKANYFNQRWYEYSGLSFEQSVGLGWEAILHPEDGPSASTKWHKALAAGQVFDTEYRLRRHDGIYCWFIGRNVPLRDDAGNVTGWFGSATDIEELKKTEKALSKSESGIRITMESATDYAIINMDTNRRVERWSKGASQIFGYTEEEMIGQPGDIIFTEKDREEGAPQAEMETARDTGRSADERWHLRKDGSCFFASGVLRPINSPTLTGYVKVLRDMTQQQMFTEELQRLVTERTIELQQSNNDLQQFAHVASHDLKEPVRKIKTFNNRIKEEFEEQLPDKVQMYLNKINSAANRMEQMIQGILDYSKLGKPGDGLGKVALNGILESIQADLEVLIVKKNATITTTTLPAIIGNTTLLYQLFYNLILNSLKFSKEGEACRITISSISVHRHQKEFAEIVVSDNGIGFEQEYAEVIFDTFTRLNSQDQYEGTGLGLALCKKIIERHHGSITADGKPGVGATFTIILPCA